MNAIEITEQPIELRDPSARSEKRQLGCAGPAAQEVRLGLRRVEAKPFDLVLSDVVMPKMDGYELYTAIRKTHPELPVLMMTAFHYDKDHIIKRSRMEGLTGVIFKKPVDPERLRETLRDCIR